MCRLRVAPRDEEPQAAKFAGGHRIRVTPVPIPNTEVKPDTADGTVWETVWESRSLPALFRRSKSPIDASRSGFLLYQIARSRHHSFPLAPPRRPVALEDIPRALQTKQRLQRRAGEGVAEHV